MLENIAAFKISLEAPSLVLGMLVSFFIPKNFHFELVTTRGLTLKPPSLAVSYTLRQKYIS